MVIQTITTEGGETLVVLSRRDYDALLARAGDEDAEDRMTLLIAAEARGEKPLPAEVSASVLNGSSLVEALRRWRGLSQEQLATAAGLTQGRLEELERNRLRPLPIRSPGLPYASTSPPAGSVDRAELRASTPYPLAVPSCSASSSRAIWSRWTSSGPSAKRSERARA